MHSRPYQNLHDFDRLRAFLSRIRSDIHHTHYLHVGDLTWQLFHMLAAYPPAGLVRLWEHDDGTLLGFGLVYPAFGFFDLQVDPAHRGGSLEAEMLHWVEHRLSSVPSRSTLVNTNDTARHTLLSQHGYCASGDWLYLERTLTTPLPTPQLPPGFSLRAVADDEATARAEVLGAVFGAPAQPETYQHLMGAPGYVRDLDCVAVAPDGRFSAFALCWVDHENHVGQFEPVGTAPECRRLGLGHAVLYEGMRRMRALGVERVIVIVDADEHAACALYRSVGLQEQWRLRLYVQG